MSTEIQFHPRHNDLELKFISTPGEAVSSALQKVAIREYTKQQAELAVRQAKEIKQVTDDDELRAALNAIGELKQLIGGIAASKKRYKDPFLKAEKMIEAACKLVSLPMEAEEERLQHIAGAFTGARKRAQALEKQRLEKLAADAQRAANQAATPEKKAMFEEVAHQTHLEAREVVLSTPGARTTLGWDVDETTPINWQLLEANYPQVVKKEIKKAILNDVIKQLELSGIPIDENTIPGIRLIARQTASPV